MIDLSDLDAHSLIELKGRKYDDLVPVRFPDGRVAHINVTASASARQRAIAFNESGERYRWEGQSNNNGTIGGVSANFSGMLLNFAIESDNGGWHRCPLFVERTIMSGFPTILIRGDDDPGGEGDRDYDDCVIAITFP